MSEITRIHYRLPFDFLLIMVMAMFLGRVLRLPRKKCAPFQSYGKGTRAITTFMY